MAETKFFYMPANSRLLSMRLNRLLKASYIKALAMNMFINNHTI